MATVVLTAAGGLVGGPVGAAVGGLIGRGIDGRVLGGRRDGPRLNDLRVQMSSYGTPIPKVLGTLRVAGTVIWATELIEHRGTAGGGKGQAGGTRYTYSASFAVALSARPIRAVHRIWAEGKLLRGRAGDWKSATKFRLHAGKEDQEADPLIASLLGRDAPAHRGVAYAVFEDLALGDFGNRIPSLTFEVEADAGPVTIGSILADLGGGMIVADDAGPSVIGYAAHGDTLRGLAGELADAAGGWFARIGGHAQFRCGDGVPLPVPATAAVAEGGPADAWRRARTVPATVVVTYHDVSRDYQTASQHWSMRGGSNAVRRLDLPAAMSATTASAIAAAIGSRDAAEQDVRRLRLDWSMMGLGAGDRIVVGEESQQWRVVSATLETMVLRVELRRVGSVQVESGAGSAGSAVLAPDLIHGATRLSALEVPPGDGDPSVPTILVLAAGTGPGWRGAALLVDHGDGWRDAGTVGTAIFGTVAVPPRTGPVAIEDREATIEVVFPHDGIDLSGADDARLDAGANLVVAGDEWFQFGTAERIGPARWQLARLRRGWRGTDWGMHTHRVGEAFVLADQPGAVFRTASALSVRANGIGDTVPAEATIVPDGRWQAPPAPTGLRLARQGTETVLQWRRRSRTDWTWRDGVDAALGEEREAYTVTMQDAAGRSFVTETAEPSVVLRPGAVRAEVRQVGTFGQSRPANIVIEGGIA